MDLGKIFRNGSRNVSTRNWSRFDLEIWYRDGSRDGSMRNLQGSNGTWLQLKNWISPPQYDEINYVHLIPTFQP